jgi:hypothetical protein
MGGAPACHGKLFGFVSRHHNPQKSEMGNISKGMTNQWPTHSCPPKKYRTQQKIDFRLNQSIT